MNRKSKNLSRPSQQHLPFGVPANIVVGPLGFRAELDIGPKGDQPCFNYDSEAD
jgi:hypothetical protein